MSPRRPQRKTRDEGPEQLILPPTPVPKRAAKISRPEEAAKIAVSRRVKPSAVPGHVKLILTLDIPGEPAERLSAQAIREGKILEAVVMEIEGEHLMPSGPRNEPVHSTTGRTAHVDVR